MRIAAAIRDVGDTDTYNDLAAIITGVPKVETDGVHGLLKLYIRRRSTPETWLIFCGKQIQCLNIALIFSIILNHISSLF